MAGLGAKLFASFTKLTAADVQGYLADQSIMRFATSVARDAAFGGVGEPTLAEGKVIITVDWSVYADPEDYDDYGIICDECGSPDVGVNSSDQIICNNCGWEEETKE